MASSSLLLSSALSSKSILFSSHSTKPFPSLLFHSFSLKLTHISISTSSLFSSHSSYAHSPSRSILKVAVSPEFEEEESEDTPSDENEETNLSQDLRLFVGNLPFSVANAELAELFGQAGDVRMAEVMYDKITGRSRGFGFVTMSSVEEVEAATQQFNGYELGGRPIRVNYGPPPPKEGFPSRESRSDDRRVYVGNLSWSVDNEALENLFSEQGKVVEARVVYDRESGRSRGFGFVTYSSSEEVDNAISSLNGVELDGRDIRVTVAESKSRRQF